MGVLIFQQVNCGRSGYLAADARDVRDVRKPQRYRLRGLEVLVPAKAEYRAGLKVTVGWGPVWKLEPRTLTPGVHSYKKIKRDNGEAILVDTLGGLWIAAETERGVAVDPLVVANFTLETV